MGAAFPLSVLRQQPQQGVPLSALAQSVGTRTLIVAMGARLVDFAPLHLAVNISGLAPTQTSQGIALANGGTGSASITGALQSQTFSRIAVVSVAALTTGTISDSMGGSTGGAQWRVESSGEMVLNKSNIANVGTSTGAGIIAGRVYVVGLTYDGSKVEFFIDGRSVGSAASSTTFSTDGNGSLFSRGGGAEKLNGAIGLHVDMPPQSAAVMRALTANPWQLFGAPTFASQIMRAAIASTVTVSAAALSGSALSVAAANGSLSTSIILAGSASGVSIASGSLTTQTLLSGSASAQSTANGSLATAIQFAGSAVSSAYTSAVLTTAITLGGSASAQSSASSSLTTAITLSGSSLSVVTAGATLAGTAVSLSGSAVAQALATGSLTTSIPLGGSAYAASSSTGNLSTSIALVGTAAGSATASGTLTSVGAVPDVTILASLIPKERWITFEGTARTVTFDGNGRVVSFDGNNRTVSF